MLSSHLSSVMPAYNKLKFLGNFREELDEGRRAMSKMSSFKMRGEEEH